MSDPDGSAGPAVVPEAPFRPRRGRVLPLVMGAVAVVVCAVVAVGMGSAAGWQVGDQLALVALGLGIAAFLGVAAVHQTIIRPNDKGSVLRVVIVTIGLLILINGLVTLIWGGEVRAVQSPFPAGTTQIGGVAITTASRSGSPSMSSNAAVAAARLAASVSS